jgi:hypothetical protein
MTSKRQPTARTGQIAAVRADAREAITREWKTAGWPQSPRRLADYERLQGCMASYLDRLFPEMDQSECAEIARQALVRFMAPLLARRDRGEHPAPEDLVRALEDAALDHAPAEQAPSDRDDKRVATLAFGVDPARVRLGLENLADDGATLEFRMVTRYLDLVDLDRTRPPSSAEVIAGLAGDTTVTELRVRRTLLDFRHRVTADTADDDT